MNGAQNLGLSGMCQMGQWQHCFSSCLDPNGFVLSVPQCWQKVSCNAVSLFLEGKLGPVCHSSELSASSLAQKIPGEVWDSSSPWGLQKMFNAAFVCKSDEVKLGFSPVSDIRYFDVHKTPWMICKSETFAWKYFPGITLRREGGGRKRERFFWSSLLKNNP